jgi:hypothetical protein
LACVLPCYCFLVLATVANLTNVSFS